MPDLAGMFSGDTSLGSWGIASDNPDYGDVGSPSLGGTSAWNLSTNLANYGNVDWKKLGWGGGDISTFNNETGEASLNPEFGSWLTAQGYRPGTMQPMAGSADRYMGVLDSSGKPLAGSTYFNQINDNQFWQAAMLAAGAISGGAATSAGMGTAGAGAVSGGVTGFMGDGTLKGAVTGAAAGGLAGGFTPNVAGYAGIENPTLASAVNAGSRSAVSTALRGGDASQVGKSALTGGTLAGLNTLGSQNMETYQPTGTGNQSLLNNINQSSNVNSTPSWMTSDIGTGGQSTYAANNSGLGVAPMFNNSDGNPETNYMQQLQSLLGMSDGRIGVGLGGGQGIKYGDLAGGLMQMYAARKQRQDAGRLMNSITGNNGAYTENLKRSLMAKDAAAGRRSNYGGREVQLQSALAQLAAQQAPSLINLQSSRDAAMLQGLQGLFTVGSRAGFLPSSGQSQPQQFQQMNVPTYSPTSIRELSPMMDAGMEEPSKARWRQGY